MYLHVSLLESVCRAFVHLRPKCCLIVEEVCVCFLTLQRVCSCIFTFHRTPGINFCCALVSWRAKRRHLILNPQHFLVSYGPSNFLEKCCPQNLEIVSKGLPLDIIWMVTWKNSPHRSFKIPKSAGCAASSGGINLQSTWVCLGCKNVKRLNLCWLSGQRFLPSKKKTEQSLDCSKSEIYHHDKKSGFRISWGNETGSCSHVLTSWPRQIVFMTASFR